MVPAEQIVGSQVKAGETNQKNEEYHNVITGPGRLQPRGGSCGFETYNQHGGQVKQEYQRCKKDDVTRFQKTVDNCFEVRKETERCDHINNRKRCKTAEYSEYVFNAAEEKDQVCNNGKDQRNYLVFGKGGHGLGNCKHTAGEQKAADITDENDGVVRGAQQVDGNPKRKSQKQGESAKHPGSEKLSPHQCGNRHRHGDYLEDGFGSEFLGPKPH